MVDPTETENTAVKPKDGGHSQVLSGVPKSDSVQDTCTGFSNSRNGAKFDHNTNRPNTRMRKLDPLPGKDLERGAGYFRPKGVP